jgi:hypothetical protein
VAYASEDHDKVLEVLSEKLSPRILRAPQRLAEVAREVDGYFARQRQAFDVALDLSLSRGFRQLVQERLPEIGYGRTRSYRDVAELVGKPQGGPRRRHRLRGQPAADRRPLPPRAARRQHSGRLHRRPRGQDHAAEPGGGGIPRRCVSSVR